VEKGLSLEGKIVRYPSMSLSRFQAKCVPFKCVNGGTSGGLVCEVLMFENASAREGSVPMWKRASHLRERLLGIQV